MAQLAPSYLLSCTLDHVTLDGAPRFPPLPDYHPTAAHQPIVLLLWGWGNAAMPCPAAELDLGNADPLLGTNSTIILSYSATYTPVLLGCWCWKLP